MTDEEFEKQFDGDDTTFEELLDDIGDDYGTEEVENWYLTEGQNIIGRQVAVSIPPQEVEIIENYLQERQSGYIRLDILEKMAPETFESLEDRDEDNPCFIQDLFPLSMYGVLVSEDAFSDLSNELIAKINTERESEVFDIE